MDLGNVGPFGVVSVLLDLCWRKNPRSLGSPQCLQPSGSRLTLTDHLQPDQKVVIFLHCSLFFSLGKQQTTSVAL